MGGGLPAVPQIDFSHVGDRTEEVFSDPWEYAKDNPGTGLSANPLSVPFSKSTTELEQEQADLLAEINKPPAVPGDDDARIKAAQAAALDKQKSRKGRAASIKTTAQGLGERAPIAKASLLG